MARRRKMYSKKKRINYGRILLLLLILVVLIGAVFLLFRKNDYLGVVKEALDSKIINITGSINSVSDIDYSIYSNEGIRYANQHENIKKLNTFDNNEISDNVMKLFQNLITLNETTTTKDLTLKREGYYWIDANFIVDDSKLFIKDENEYNFDLYYDIDEQVVYIKEKYYNEFSKKNNKTELRGFVASDEFVEIIDNIIK